MTALITLHLVLVGILSVYLVDARVRLLRLEGRARQLGKDAEVLRKSLLTVAYATNRLNDLITDDSDEKEAETWN